MSTPSNDTQIKPVKVTHPTQTKDFPVICNGCKKSCRPEDMRIFKGKRRCKKCVQEQEEKIQRDQILQACKHFISQTLDLGRMRQTKELEPTDPTTVMDSFYHEFGGPTEFGLRWAQLVRKTMNDALSGGKGVNAACKMALDVFKATAATHNAFQDRDIERMSLEEAEKAREEYLQAELARLAMDASNKNLLQVIAMLGDETDPEEFRNFFSELNEIAQDKLKIVDAEERASV